MSVNKIAFNVTAVTVESIGDLELDRQVTISAFLALLVENAAHPITRESQVWGPVVP